MCENRTRLIRRTAQQDSAMINATLITFSDHRWQYSVLNLGSNLSFCEPDTSPVPGSPSGSVLLCCYIESVYVFQVPPLEFPSSHELTIRFKQAPDSE